MPHEMQTTFGRPRPGSSHLASDAAAFGVNQRSVFRWLADFTNGGQNALLAKPIPGRPSKLTAEELAWIANAVRDHNPQQFKFEFGLWTLSLIRHLIKRQLKKELSVSSVHRLMKTLGFSAQKPLYQAWQQDPVLVRTWETETYPAIRAEAKRVGATIYFGDESGIRSDHHTGTTWAPQGQTPVVRATGRRFSLNMISAVSTQGEFRFMLHEGSRLREGFSGVPQALDGQCREAGVSDCRWSFDPQSKAGEELP